MYNISFRCSTQLFHIFVDYMSFKATVNYWLYSLHSTIYPCGFFILYVVLCTS